MIETLAQIIGNAPVKFTAGLVLHDNVVIEAPPILGYMKRDQWTRDRVREYCRKRGWRVSVVSEQRKPGSPRGKAGVS